MHHNTGGTTLRQSHLQPIIQKKKTHCLLITNLSTEVGLVFLCDNSWPRYPLEDGERWPVGGSLKCNTVLQLDQFCKEQGKCVEVAYVLPFFFL